MAKLYAKKNGGNSFADGDDGGIRDDIDSDYSVNDEDEHGNKIHVPFFLEIEECPD